MNRRFAVCCCCIGSSRLRMGAHGEPQHKACKAPPMSHSKQKIARGSASQPVVGNKQLEEVPQGRSTPCYRYCGTVRYRYSCYKLGGSKMSHKLAPRRNRLETHAIAYYRSSRFLCMFSGGPGNRLSLRGWPGCRLQRRSEGARPSAGSPRRRHVVLQHGIWQPP